MNCPQMYTQEEYNSILNEIPLRVLRTYTKKKYSTKCYYPCFYIPSGILSKEYPILDKEDEYRCWAYPLSAF